MVAKQQVEQPRKKRKRAETKGPADPIPPTSMGSTPVGAAPAKERSKKTAKTGKTPVEEGKSAPMERAEPLRQKKKFKEKELEPEAATNGSLEEPPRGVGSTPEASSAMSKAPWWGASLFVSSGCLEGLDKQAKQSERKSFTEDTQADLYNASQAAKTAGKKGLGVGQGRFKL